MASGPPEGARAAGTTVAEESARAPDRAQGDGAPAAFAEVAVAPPLRRVQAGRIRGIPPHVATFHYGLPDEVRDVVAPGSLVWVPFGRDQRMGVVVALSAKAPVDHARPVGRPARPEPALGPDLLALGAWMSATYLAPLFECYAAMLPPGALEHELELFSRTTAPILVAENDPRSLVVLGAFAGGKELTAAEVGRLTGVRYPEEVLGPLVARGLLLHATERRGRGPQPRARSFARLLEEDAAAWGAALEGVRRITSHWRQLVVLAAAGEPVLVGDLLAAAKGTQNALDGLVRVGLVALDERIVWRDPLAGRSFSARGAPPLTPDQEAAWRVIADALAGRRSETAPAPPVDPKAPPAAETGGPDDPPVVLLHGVTGSGKTELYLRAIQSVLDAGGGAIVLVPEISLAPQTVQRVAGRFGDLVGVWHSQLTEGERADTWERTRRGELRVVVGSRSAVFAPIHNLALIILDEEHAESFKQEASPRYHARNVAIVRARHAGAAVLLGSATPSVESFWHAQRGRFRLAELPRRVAPVEARATYLELPEVTIVDMRAELKAGNRTIFSRLLAEGIEEVLAEGRQAILFLNRRGSATFVMCRDCGAVVKCPRCDLPLTYHEPGAALVCHHCAHAEPPPMMCRECGSRFIRYFGVGTERVATEAAERFPHARVLRWDADMTKRRGSHEALLASFVSGRADILVGTQMIAKGLDLPQVTLVGVVSADTTLGLPDLRSGERTFQLLAQVAGRSGRAAHPGRVIFQTYRPEEPAIRFAAGHDFAGFFRRELAFRGEHLYPPYSRLVRLERQGTSEGATRRAAEEAALALQAEVRRLGLPDTEIIGPAPCFFRRVRGKFRWQVVVRSPQPHMLLAEYELGPGWRVDVDPLSSL